MYRHFISVSHQTGEGHYTERSREPPSAGAFLPGPPLLHSRPHPEMSETDPGFIVALDEAKKGAAEGGVPIGACLVSKDGKILGQGHNMRIQKGSATLHVSSFPLQPRALPLGETPSKPSLFLTRSLPAGRNVRSRSIRPPPRQRLRRRDYVHDALAL